MDKMKVESGKWKVRAVDIAEAVFVVCFWPVFYWAVTRYQLGYLATVAIFTPILFVGVLSIALIKFKLGSGG